jgi:sRNA-binding carbon storage regulator CsrA
MAVLKRKKQESVIVAGSGGLEQLLKVTIVDVEGEDVTLKFEVAAGVMVHSGEEWASLLASRAAKAAQGTDRPRHKAAYSD